MIADRIGEYLNKHKRAVAVYGAVFVASAKLISDRYDGYAIDLDPRISRPLEGRHGPRVVFSDQGPEYQISYTRGLRSVFCGDGLPFANTTYITRTEAYSLNGKKVYETSSVVPAGRACERLIGK